MEIIKKKRKKKEEERSSSTLRRRRSYYTQQHERVHDDFERGIEEVFYEGYIYIVVRRKIVNGWIEQRFPETKSPPPPPPQENKEQPRKFV